MALFLVSGYEIIESLGQVEFSTVVEADTTKDAQLEAQKKRRQQGAVEVFVASIKEADEG